MDFNKEGGCGESAGVTAGDVQDASSSTSGWEGAEPSFTHMDSLLVLDGLTSCKAHRVVKLVTSNHRRVSPPKLQ